MIRPLLFRLLFPFLIACSEAGGHEEPLLRSADRLLSRRGDFEVVVQMSPGTAGTNHCDIYLEDFGRVDPRVGAVELSFQYLDFHSSVIKARAVPVHPDHFMLDGDYLRHPGRWSIEV